MAQKMRTRVDGVESLLVCATTDGRCDVAGAGLGAEHVGNFAVEAARLRLESRSDVDHEVSKRAVRDAAVRAHATAAEAEDLVEDRALGELAGVTGLVPVRENALEAAFADEELECLQVVAVVRQELSCRVDLQRMDLVQRDKLVPAGLGSWETVELLGRGHHTFDGVKISFLVGVAYVMPRNFEGLVSSCPLCSQSSQDSPRMSLFGRGAGWRHIGTRCWQSCSERRCRRQDDRRCHCAQHLGVFSTEQAVSRHETVPSNPRAVH